MFRSAGRAACWSGHLDLPLQVSSPRTGSPRTADQRDLPGARTARAAGVVAAYLDTWLSAHFWEFFTIHSAASACETKRVICSVCPVDQVTSTNQPAPCLTGIGL